MVFICRKGLPYQRSSVKISTLSTLIRTSSGVYDCRKNHDYLLFLYIPVIFFFSLSPNIREGSCWCSRYPEILCLTLTRYTFILYPLFSHFRVYKGRLVSIKLDWSSSDTSLIVGGLDGDHPQYIALHLTPLFR